MFSIMRCNEVVIRTNIMKCEFLGLLEQRSLRLNLSEIKDMVHVFCYFFQLIVEMDVALLAHLLQDTENFAKSIQEACQRHLDERTQTAEAMDLLRLYHTARQSSPYVEDTGPKRQKHAHT